MDGKYIYGVISSSNETAWGISGLGNFDVTVKGQDLAVEIRFHSIWAKRDNGLQFVSWEATRTPVKQ